MNRLILALVVAAVAGLAVRVHRVRTAVDTLYAVQGVRR